MLSHHRHVGAGTIVSRGIDRTLTCCRSALMWAIITTSELATLLVEASTPPIAAFVVPARLSEPISRTFCEEDRAGPSLLGDAGAVEVASCDVASGEAAGASAAEVLTLVCGISALTWCCAKPTSALCLMFHSTPTPSRVDTASTATTARPIRPIHRRYRRCCAADAVTREPSRL